MKMSLSRRLSEALGSWLHMEFCCYRAGLLSENSFKASVGAILSAFPSPSSGARVYADQAINELNMLNGRGRKRSVDFSLHIDNEYDVVVETKWAGSSHCTSENIFSDFLRLAAIKKQRSNCMCIFILAGQVSKMNKCLDLPPFRGERGIDAISPDQGKEKAVHLHKNKLDPISLSAFGKFQSRIGIDLKRFNVCSSGLFPDFGHIGKVDFQAIAWDVRSAI
jgi:hypothetical protein